MDAAAEAEKALLRLHAEAAQAKARPYLLISAKEKLKYVQPSEGLSRDSHVITCDSRSNAAAIRLLYGWALTANRNTVKR